MLTLFSLAIAYALFATAFYLATPIRRITSIDFRLDFEGASEGTYPNGVKFSTGDITAAPVLLRVWEANKLVEYVPFDEFSRSVFVLESNRDFDQLVLEYRSKLADPRLSPVDRERIEREFQEKRAGISKSQYSINHMETDQLRPIPQTLVRKALTDTLATWARDAAIKKKVLQYRVPVLSGNVIDRPALLASNNPVVSLTIIRKKIVDILGNIQLVASIPGVELIRTDEGQASLAELRLRLQDLLRFRVEPLILAARSNVGHQASTLRILEAQLRFDERAVREAQLRVEALQTALAAYENRPVSEGDRVSDRSVPLSMQPGDRAETVMPQISEGFIDRLVEMTSRNSDREYRQRIAADVREAALAVIPAQQAVAYDRELLEAFSRMPPGPTDSTALTETQREMGEILDQLDQTIRQVNEIYRTVSLQLNPVTELYGAQSPPTVRVERSTSVSRLALYGILLLALALPVVIAGVFIHRRFREEEQPPRASEPASA